MPSSLRFSANLPLGIVKRPYIPYVFGVNEVAHDVAGCLLACTLEYGTGVVAAFPVALAVVIGVVDDLGVDEADESEEESHSAGDGLQYQCGLSEKWFGRLQELERWTRLEKGTEADLLLKKDARDASEPSQDTDSSCRVDQGLVGRQVRKANKGRVLHVRAGTTIPLIDILTPRLIHSVRAMSCEVYDRRGDSHKREREEGDADIQDQKQMRPGESHLEIPESCLISKLSQFSRWNYIYNSLYLFVLGASVRLVMLALDA